MSGSFERRQQQRYAVLRHMHEVAVEEKNDPTMSFHEDLIVEGLAYLRQDVRSALNYLEGKHLVKVVIVYDPGTKSYELSHQGIEEIERSFQKPEEPTEHFPAPINMYFNAPVGAVQPGSHAVANVNQNIGVNLSDVFDLMEQMKSQVAELPQEQQESASDSVEMLEEELKSQAKSPERVKRSLERLGRMARGTLTFSSQVATLAQKLKDLNLF